MHRWNDYLTPNPLSVEGQRKKSAPAFAGQKENIRKLLNALSPKTVLCLGAGYLNDIPVEDFIRKNMDIYLAEWMQDTTEPAFRHSLIHAVEERLACIICQCSSNPQKYCKSYKERATGTSPEEYCENFAIAPGNAIAICNNYAPGSFPQFLTCDVTQGRATDFATRVPAIVLQAQKPRQAFRRAIEKSAISYGCSQLPLEDHSMDFITSSMVVSQFDFEPYTYFLHTLIGHFGEEAILEDRKKLEELEKVLRDSLFLSLVEGHCQEILRLLKPTGRVYFSIETMHHAYSAEPWFQPEITPKAMALIGKYFYFDIDTLPETLMAERVTMASSGESVIQAYLLAAKGNV